MTKPNIFIVEDDKLVALDLKSTLEMLGYNVLGHASSAEEAYALISKLNPDIVLMDIRIEGSINGVEAADYIHKNFNIPIVFLTSVSDDGILQSVMSSEPYGYIIKPFEERQLNSTLKLALHKHIIEKKLMENERWLAAILKSIGDAVIVIDLQGRICFMNTAAVKLTGHFVGNSTNTAIIEILKILDKEKLNITEYAIAMTFETKSVFKLPNNICLLSRKGTQIPISGSFSPIIDDYKSISGIVITLNDITERKHYENELNLYRSHMEELLEERTIELKTTNIELEKKIIIHREFEDELSRINRSLNILYKVNEALIHAIEENSLNRDICRIIIERGGYKFAWVGYAENDSLKSIIPIASNGIDNGYLKAANITWSDSEWGRGPAGMAVRTGKPHVFNDIHKDPNFRLWLDEAAKRGFASIIGLPLLEGKKAFGVLTIYSDKVNRFDTEETNLLINIAKDLAYGIKMLRIQEEQKMNSDFIRESKEKYRILFEDSPISLIEVDLSAIKKHIDNLNEDIDFNDYINDNQEIILKYIMMVKIIDVNKMTLEMNKFGSKESLYLNLPRLLTDELYDTLRESLGAIANDEHTFETESTIKIYNGEIRNIYIKWSVAPGYESTYSKVIISIIDTTERKRAEQKLKESLEKLVLSEKMAAIGELASGVAHELNQPLNHIAITAQLIERMIELKDYNEGKLISEIKIIHDNINRSSDVIKSLRDFSRKEVSDSSPINVKVSIKNALNMLEKQLLVHNIELILNMPEHPVIAMGSVNQLGQVIINLLINSRDALDALNQKENKPAKLITMSVSETEDNVIIKVTDNGIGVHEKIKPHVFDPFFTTKETGKGTGLGLSISKRIIDSFGGSIHMDSTEGSGTVMTIILRRGS